MRSRSGCTFLLVLLAGAGIVGFFGLKRRPAPFAGRPATIEILEVDNEPAAITCTVDRAWELADKGDVAGALALLKPLAGDPPGFNSKWDHGGQSLEAAWAAAEFQRRLGGDDAEQKLTEEISRLVMWGSSGADIAKPVVPHLLKRVLPALKAEGPRRESAEYLTGILLSNAPRQFVPVFKDLGNEAPAFLISLLHWWSRARPGLSGHDIAELLEAATPINDDALCDALAAAVEDDSKSATTRKVARTLLTEKAEMPFQISELRDEPAVNDADLAAAALWRKIRPLSRVERHRRKVEFAVDRNVDPAWFEAATGQNVRKNKDVHAWWEQHGAREPAAWLRTRLGIPAETTPADLLRRFLEAGSKDRPSLHHLLTLSVDADVRTPCWNAGISREPRTLAMSWWRALGSPEPRQLHLRTALLVFGAGDPLPEIRWEVATPIRTGQYALIKADAPDVTRGGLQSLEALATVRQDSAGHTARFIHVREDPANSTSGKEGHVGTAFVACLPREGPFGAVILVAAVTEDARPRWTLEDWKTAFVEEFARLDDAKRRGDEAFLEHHQQNGWTGNYLGSYLPLADSKALRAVTWNSTRLLAGDESVIPQIGSDFFEPMLEKGKSHGAYWTRVVIATRSTQIREAALEQLRNTGMTKAHYETILKARREGRVTFEIPAWMIERDKRVGGE